MRAAVPSDHDALWAILEPVIRAGETWALPRDMRRDEALAYWHDGKQVVVAEIEGRVVGTYFIRPNQMGGGSHVANGGYMTAAEAQGRGVARAMVADSLVRARVQGFRAMQFNFVVSSNERAVKTWQAAGFEIAARLPGAFDHATLGFVDVYVMYRTL
ncbi:MAG TPA: GNAT family N-acetyltransferase [Luteitalea sp.]|nr:GNAT family N-acetyltransferase [Luteitalea sp.]